MEMECPHLRVHRGAPVKGLIEPGNDGLPCGIDELRVLSTDDDLHSLIYDCWELRTPHTPGNEDALGKITSYHATLAAVSMRLWL